MLSYSFKIPDHDELTRRNILRILTAQYDPIGLAAPILILAKRLFQESCRLNLEWDDPLPNEIMGPWKKWLADMKDIIYYEIPRPLKVESIVSKFELHTFCDGSELAYGSVSYIRCIYESDACSISLLSAKSRLTPINSKTLRTVPRIELCSAKLAVELSQQLVRELEYPIDELFYWSDSTVVLHYLKNESTRYKRFVADKVSFIRSFTNPEQWRHVRSEDNPADLVSRGMTAGQLASHTEWKCGPMFLHSKLAQEESKLE